MSCQTTHQLRRLTGQESDSGPTAPSGLFDWLICPLASSIALLDKQIPDFSRNQIQVQKGRAYWPKFNLYFWHSFLVKGETTHQVDIDANFEAELRRWRHLRDRFSELDPRHTIFVVSNTQNNLETEVFEQSEQDQYLFTGKLLDQLKHSLGNYFKTTSYAIQLEVLSRESRMSATDGLPTPVTYLPTDHNEWKGSRKSWDNWWDKLNL
ncbi:hypothetical protein AB833_21285 [Chromatiales bacterium (ex Bugula neritina AB1)]|nr:hypothetical protein AB833_21285 [Chromatiales bacterium (ex Bugula neritina AB1)]